MSEKFPNTERKLWKSLLTITVSASIALVRFSLCMLCDVLMNILKFLSYPLETVKRIMQATPSPDDALETTLTLIQDSGTASLWRGFTWALLKLIPSATLLVLSERLFTLQ